MQKTPAEAKEMEQIIRRFELPLLQYAARIMGDRDRARDVVQEPSCNFSATVPNYATMRRQNGSSRSVAIARSMFVEKKSA